MLTIATRSANLITDNKLVIIVLDHFLREFANDFCHEFCGQFHICFLQDQNLKIKFLQDDSTIYWIFYVLHESIFTTLWNFVFILFLFSPQRHVRFVSPEKSKRIRKSSSWSSFDGLEPNDGNSTDHSSNYSSNSEKETNLYATVRKSGRKHHYYL